MLQISKMVNNNQYNSIILCKCKIINDLNVEKDKIEKDILDIMSRLGFLGFINIFISIICIVIATFLYYLLNDDNLQLIFLNIACFMSVMTIYLSFAYTNCLYNKLCSKGHHLSQLCCMYFLIRSRNT